MSVSQPRPVNASPAASTATHSVALGQSIANSAAAPVSVVADQLDGFVLPASARPLPSTATHRFVVGHEMLVSSWPVSIRGGLTECLGRGLNATAAPRVSIATHSVVAGHETSSSSSSESPDGASRPTEASIAVRVITVPVTGENVISWPSLSTAVHWVFDEHADPVSASPSST